GLRRRREGADVPDPHARLREVLPRQEPPFRGHAPREHPNRGQGPRPGRMLRGDRSRSSGGAPGNAPPSTQSTPPLCVADDATFWPWLSHSRFGALPNRAGTVVILPLCGMADWGLGHALDAEETVLMHVLRDACRLAMDDRKPLVVPPLRFAFGADPSCAFAVDQPTAHSLIAEVAASVAAAGFRKIVILNSSPWSEELCSAAARDLRVSRGLQMFQVHLSALGLDFHPVRSRSRRAVQTLVTALSGVEAEPSGQAGAGAPRT